MATITTTNTATYSDCVSSLRTSLSFLESSVDTLGSGVSDFPRLINVLKSVRHYELIPQPSLAAAEHSLRSEIGPAISVLLDRADAHIDRVDRRVEALKARAELQAGRLVAGHDDDDDDDEHYGSHGTNRKKGAAGRKSKGRELTADAKLRARVLRQRKEALKYSVERLELEVLQKERELRKRLDSA
ncbi:DASH complex subunit Spc19 [Xylariomycetidae sp. FL2044]|nr:DASH complex subunit Spc19 [Xylariomycetidae sp. FL2044]